MLDEVGGGGFAVGAGDTDQFELAGRLVIKPSCGEGTDLG